MIQASRDFQTIYFSDGLEAAKFLKCSYRQIMDTLWLNSGMNKQSFSYSGFPVKKQGEHTRKGWILKEVELSVQEAALRNAIAGLTFPVSPNPK